MVVREMVDMVEQAAQQHEVNAQLTDTRVSPLSAAL
jgi:hypothetical protein